MIFYSVKACKIHVLVKLWNLLMGVENIGLVKLGACVELGEVTLVEHDGASREVNRMLWNCLR